MTKAVRSYVIFVGVLAIFAFGLMAVKVSPAARRWYETGRNQGTLIRTPNAVPARSAEIGRPQALPNIAPFATVTVSSTDDAGFSQGVADGIVDAQEWKSNTTTADAWIMLNWQKPALVEEIDLYDRINPNDNVRSGVLTFEDGSTISVGALPTGGDPAQIKFPPKIVKWVMFRINTAQGRNAGLAELMVRGILNP